MTEGSSALTPRGPATTAGSSPVRTESSAAIAGGPRPDPKAVATRQQASLQRPYALRRRAEARRRIPRASQSLGELARRRGTLRIPRNQATFVLGQGVPFTAEGLGAPRRATEGSRGDRWRPQHRGFSRRFWSVAAKPRPRPPGAQPPSTETNPTDPAAKPSTRLPSSTPGSQGLAGRKEPASELLP